MVDVKSRRCSEPLCDRYPAFNYPDETLSKFCGVHRKEGMIDVHNKRCQIDGCSTRPSFNFPGELLTLWSEVVSAPTTTDLEARLNITRLGGAD